MSGIINCATSMTVCARGTGLDAENLSGFSSQGELFLLTSFFIEPKGCRFESCPRSQTFQTLTGLNPSKIHLICASVGTFVGMLFHNGEQRRASSLGVRRSRTWLFLGRDNSGHSGQARGYWVAFARARFRPSGEFALTPFWNRAGRVSHSNLISGRRTHVPGRRV
jgi:hypothetical protein